MWSLGALLFGHLTRNCRCSHCPGINSNYALYSDGFCTSEPPAPPLLPLLSPLLIHTRWVLTHISRFSLPSPTPCFPSHSSTGELIWLLEHPGPIMNELAEICTFRQGKEDRRKIWNAHSRSISGVIPELKQFFTLHSVDFFSSIKMHYVGKTVRCTIIASTQLPC